MRELTTAELDFISGGYYSSNDEDIVVTGSPYPPPYSPPYYSPPPYYNPPTSPPVYGGSPPPITHDPEPSGNIRGANHVDMDRLVPPGANIDLDDCEVVLFALGNHDVKIVFDNKTLPLGSAERQTATLAFQSLTRDFNNLNAAAQESLSHLDHIVFTNVPDSSTVTGRSFSTEANGTFFYDSSEFKNASMGFMESNMLHDANHIAIYDRTGDYNQSRGTASEVSGWQMQIDNAATLGLTTQEVSYLQRLVNDPTQGRGGTPAYPTSP